MGTAQGKLTTSFAALIEEHRSRRPGMELRDLYKLLYQGVRGPEHILSSAEAFRQWLKEEWEALEPSLEDPLSEAIRPDGRLLRLNLRPYKVSGGQLEPLVAACLKAGQAAWGTQADLQQAWNELQALCCIGAWQGFSLENSEAFTAWLQEHDFPPVHHSETYRQLYRPAYRLVLAPPETFEADLTSRNRT